MNGMVFKAAIFKCQITQRQIAKMLECSPSIISMALRGYRAFKKSDAEKLAKILDVKTDELFPEYAEKSIS